MKLKHKVSISVREPDGGTANVLGGGEVRLREKFLRWLFGEKKKVLVIAPGDSVFNVEIREENFHSIFDECLDGVIGTHEHTGAREAIGAHEVVGRTHEAAPVHAESTKEAESHEAVAEC